MSGEGAGVSGTFDGLVEIEAGVLNHFLDGMTWMHAFQRKAAVREREQAAVGNQRDRPAGAEHIRLAGAGRADEVDLRYQSAARMLGAEQDHLRHNIIEIGRAKDPGKRTFG